MRISKNIYIFKQTIPLFNLFSIFFFQVHTTMKHMEQMNHFVGRATLEKCARNRNSMPLTGYACKVMCLMFLFCFHDTLNQIWINLYLLLEQKIFFVFIIRHIGFPVRFSFFGFGCVTSDKRDSELKVCCFTSTSNQIACLNMLR